MIRSKMINFIIIGCVYSAAFTLCTTNSSVDSKCIYESEPNIYNRARSVLRITNRGLPHCTGFLVGDQGHILTNYHCAFDASFSKSLNFEAMAESSDCSLDCKHPLDCEGITLKADFVASSGNFDDDWTLFKLKPKELKIALENYGYLKIRASGPILGERIYIVGHPLGFGKQIVLKNRTGFGTSLDTECGTEEIVYALEVQIGNSGAPVIAYSDDSLIGLHRCNDCTRIGNSAVNAVNLYKGLENLLPSSAWA